MEDVFFGNIKNVVDNIIHQKSFDVLFGKKNNETEYQKEFRVNSYLFIKYIDVVYSMPRT